jgi:hypothetical protein
VLVGVADTHRGRQHGSQSRGYLALDRVGQERVGSDWQMTTVMLDRAERHDHTRDALDAQLIQLLRGQPFEFVQRQPSTR